MAVRDNTKADNSVKQTSSLLHIRGCVHLPLQQVFKIIRSPDSTFYKLHSDIYFAKVLSPAIRERTIFRKTVLKVCSTLNKPNKQNLSEIIFLKKNSTFPSVKTTLDTLIHVRNGTSKHHFLKSVKLSHNLAFRCERSFRAKQRVNYS